MHGSRMVFIFIYGCISTDQKVYDFFDSAPCSVLDSLVNKTSAKSELGLCAKDRDPLLEGVGNNDRKGHPKSQPGRL